MQDEPFRDQKCGKRHLHHVIQLCFKYINLIHVPAPFDDMIQYPIFEYMG